MPKKASFDRQDLLEAALKVARRVGLDALSMRMVAEELGVSAMAAYRHVPSRESLVAWVADELAAEVRLPPPEFGTWDQRLRALELAAFRARAVVPGQPETAVLTAGPHHRRIADGVMEILIDAGLTPEDAAVAFEVLWAYFQGQLRIYDQLMVRDVDDPHGATPRWLGLEEIIQRVPSLSAEDFFDRGFEILLDGLRVRIEATRRARAQEGGAQPGS
jgi:AcrR family transcriptional regulator